MFRPINSAKAPYVKFLAGAAIAKGQVLVNTSEKPFLPQRLFRQQSLSALPLRIVPMPPQLKSIR